MKVILGQVILNYDFEFADPGAKRLWNWRSTILPNPETKIIFTPINSAY
jgi:hypothetical protein